MRKLFSVLFILLLLLTACKSDDNEQETIVADETENSEPENTEDIEQGFSEASMNMTAEVYLGSNFTFTHEIKDNGQEIKYECEVTTDYIDTNYYAEGEFSFSFRVSSNDEFSNVEGVSADYLKQIGITYANTKETAISASSMLKYVDAEDITTDEGFYYGEDLNLDYEPGTYIVGLSTDGLRYILIYNDLDDTPYSYQTTIDLPEPE